MSLPEEKAKPGSAFGRVKERGYLLRSRRILETGYSKIPVMSGYRGRFLLRILETRRDWALRSGSREIIFSQEKDIREKKIYITRRKESYPTRQQRSYKLCRVRRKEESRY
ncbi:hypothetical protein ES705_15560 [subsurface metagenome]